MNARNIQQMVEDLLWSNNYTDYKVLMADVRKLLEPLVLGNDGLPIERDQAKIIWTRLEW